MGFAVSAAEFLDTVPSPKDPSFGTCLQINKRKKAFIKQNPASSAGFLFLFEYFYAIVTSDIHPFFYKILCNSDIFRYYYATTTVW